MIHFQHPQLLWLLCLIPILIGIYIWVRIARKHRLARFADNSMFQRLTPEVSRWRPIAKSSLVLLSFALLIIAIANPQVGSKLVKGERIGSDIAICFDISNSMMAEDIQPNRLERSKRVIANLMNGLAGDRISLIVFAGSSYIQMPLTNDYSAAQLFLDQINCEQISVQGTAIGDAIEKGMETFGYGDPDREWEQNHGRAIIVISDGENFEDDACTAAAQAHDEGIMVCTIGMGGPDGVPIPEYRGGQAVGYKHDAQGNTITTRLNEQMLTDIAHSGHGIYVRGTNVNAGLHDILKEIENLEKNSYGESMFSEYESRYYYPLIAALLCLITELLLLERRNRRLDWSRLIRREKKAPLILLLIFAGMTCMAQTHVAPKTTTPIKSKISQQMKPSHKDVRQGNRNYKKGHFEEAETCYRKAVDHDSTYYKSQYNLGNALYKQKRYDEAIPHYQQALQQPALSKKMQSNTLHNLGNSHLQAGIQDRQNGMQHFQQAVQHYQKALTLDPKSEDTRYNLSYAKKLLQQAQQNQQNQQQNGGDQNQDQQNQSQQNQDQQNKDQQNQNQQNKDKQNQQQQNQDQQNQDQQNQQQRDQQKQQQKQQQKKEQAEQMLKAVENNEKKTMKNQYKKLEVGQPGRIEKDW